MNWATHELRLGVAWSREEAMAMATQPVVVEPDDVSVPAVSVGEAFSPNQQSFGHHSERRTGRVRSLQSCRLCWKPITLDAQHVEEAELYLYFRCPNCGRSFPIRRRDMTVRSEQASSPGHDDLLTETSAA